MSDCREVRPLQVKIAVVFIHKSTIFSSNRVRFVANCVFKCLVFDWNKIWNVILVIVISDNFSEVDESFNRLEIRANSGNYIS